VAAGVHANTLSHPFTWDDGYNIVENEAIRSLANVPSFFVEAWGAHADEAMNQAINTNYYRPVSLASYALDHAVFGLNPAAFHGVNVALHALCAALVLVIGWRLVERLGGPKGWRWGVTAGALLFAVHPVHTEVVNVITYRTDLLAAVFYAAMLVAWIGPSSGRGPRAERWMIYGVAPLLYALGLGSKEMAVTAPGACFALDLLVTARATTWRTRLARMAPLAVVLAAYLGARAALLSPSAYTYFADAPTADVVTTMLAVFGRYVGLLISPWPLNPFYDWSILQPGAETQMGAVLGGAFLLMAWITATLVFARRRPVWALFLGFLPLVLLPVSHVSPIAVAAAERFLYLAMAGPLLALGLLAATLAETRSRRSMAIGVFALVLLMFSTLTWIRNEDWRSDRAILEAAVRDWPTSYNHWYGLAKLEEREGFPERALPIYERLGREEDVARLTAP
jgi:hypothetical protein